MLNKTENKVMCLLLELGNKKTTFLITPLDLLNMLAIKGLTTTNLEKIINALCVDGFIDLVYSDRHGEKVYCITLLEKGKCFRRNGEKIKRTLIFKLVVTVCFAFLSFLLGLILKAIF